ncbi:MAG: type II toxin-antitoxin system RelE/ParE family toxin [Deltaproteobacteria bacterium]|nr:type II toxin-antitoxin system RelE/ParE family toxin [Deltaproteobacteria bacterium]
MSSVKHRLKVPHDLVQLVRKLHPAIKKKIRDSLDMIVEDPLAGKPLKDEFEGLRSFRVSRFRIVYRYEEGKHIEIVTIGPRKSIYIETYRRLHMGKA